MCPCRPRLARQSVVVVVLVVVVGVGVVDILDTFWTLVVGCDCRPGEGERGRERETNVESTEASCVGCVVAGRPSLVFVLSNERTGMR